MDRLGVSKPRSHVVLLYLCWPPKDVRTTIRRVGTAGDADCELRYYAHAGTMLHYCYEPLLSQEATWNNPDMWTPITGDPKGVSGPA